MKAKRIVYGALLLTLVACSPKNSEREKAPIRVVVEKVSAQAVASDGKTYVGVVEENQATVVSYTTMGTLKHVAVSEGQRLVGVVTDQEFTFYFEHGVISNE